MINNSQFEVPKTDFSQLICPYIPIDYWDFFYAWMKIMLGMGQFFGLFFS